MIERIESLYSLRVHERMGDLPADLLRRYARRLAGRPPSAGALISLSAAETARMIPQVSAAPVRQAMRWAADE